uniref:Uncharacterized protein n=1 Tax=Timema shepardi TaxID=629360 RepID=A0A7R9AY72_TIMSH|nr:unnamed protein product [Timema shepardi]
MSGQEQTDRQTDRHGVERMELRLIKECLTTESLTGRVGALESEHHQRCGQKVAGRSKKLGGPHGARVHRVGDPCSKPTTLFPKPMKTKAIEWILLSKFQNYATVTGVGLYAQKRFEPQPPRHRQNRLNKACRLARVPTNANPLLEMCNSEVAEFKGVTTPLSNKRMDQVETPGKIIKKQPMPGVSVEALDDFTRDSVCQVIYKMYHEGTISKIWWDSTKFTCKRRSTNDGKRFIVCIKEDHEEMNGENVETWMKNQLLISCTVYKIRLTLPDEKTCDPSESFSWRAVKELGWAWLSVPRVPSSAWTPCESEQLCSYKSLTERPCPHTTIPRGGKSARSRGCPGHARDIRSTAIHEQILGSPGVNKMFARSLFAGIEPYVFEKFYVLEDQAALKSLLANVGSDTPRIIVGGGGGRKSVGASFKPSKNPSFRRDFMLSNVELHRFKSPRRLKLGFIPKHGNLLELSVDLCLLRPTTLVLPGVRRGSASSGPRGTSQAILFLLDVIEGGGGNNSSRESSEKSVSSSKVL